MGKRKSKRKKKAPGPDAIPPPRPRKSSWVIYAVVGGVVLVWLVVMASWILG